MDFLQGNEGRHDSSNLQFLIGDKSRGKRYLDGNTPSNISLEGTANSAAFMRETCVVIRWCALPPAQALDGYLRILIGKRSTIKEGVLRLKSIIIFLILIAHPFEAHAQQSVDLEKEKAELLRTPAFNLHQGVGLNELAGGIRRDAILSNYSRSPSIILIGDSVGIILVSLKPAASNSVRYSSSMRSRPPVMTSMFRSMNLLKCGSLPCGTTASTSKSLPFSAIAR